MLGGGASEGRPPFLIQQAKMQRQEKWNAGYSTAACDRPQKTTPILSQSVEHIVDAGASGNQFGLGGAFQIGSAEAGRSAGRLPSLLSTTPGATRAAQGR